MFLTEPVATVTPIIDSSMLANVEPQLKAIVDIALPVSIGAAVIVGGFFFVKRLVRSSFK